ncbi:MAG TPA: hypothetical protein PK867_23775 [Pirellulales bacterium]|nr:hypothetical protein [Pirellulales bacterium]
MLSAAEFDWCVAYHAALPLAEIRRRQELTDRQIGMAWRQRNDFALNNLRMREEILRRATEQKLPAHNGARSKGRASPSAPRPSGLVPVRR